MGDVTSGGGRLGSSWISTSKRQICYSLDNLFNNFGLSTMPPQASSSSLPPPSAKLSLQEWLKVLSSRGVDMRVAMGLAAKMYDSFIGFKPRSLAN